MRQIDSFQTIALTIILGGIFLLSACKEDALTEKDPVPEGDIKVLLNTPHQTMHHFGASDAWGAEWVGRWPDQDKEPVARLLFSREKDEAGNPEGIGLSMWRFNIGEGTGDMDDSGFAFGYWNREIECFLNPDGSYDWNKQAGAQWFLKKAREYGVDYFTGWTTSPPYFMTKNGYTFRTEGIGGFNLATENYGKFASYLATVVKKLEDEGYPFVAISPFNEPQHAWLYKAGEAGQSGSYATNSEIAAITKVIDEKFEALGVSSKIMIPEAATLADLYKTNNDFQVSDQLAAFFGEGSNFYLGGLSNVSKNIAGHSYWINKDVATAIAHRKNLLSAMRQVNGLEYWQTEYSLLGADYRDGRDWTEMEDMDYALWLARIIHWDVTLANCSGWSFWTALNNSAWGDHPNRFGLIQWDPEVEGHAQTSGSFEATKNLWVLGNFSRFVRPGMVRIAVADAKYATPEAAATAFMISGYRNVEENELVLVAINYSDTNREMKIQNYAEEFKVEGNVFEAYTTSATKDLEKSAVAADAINIPAKAVVTLVGRLK